jgi:hypothetical protein
MGYHYPTNHPNVWICPPNRHCGMVNVVLNHINFGGTYSQTNPDFDFGHFNASISRFFWRNTFFVAIKYQGLHFFSFTQVWELNTDIKKLQNNP